MQSTYTKALFKSARLADCDVRFYVLEHDPASDDDTTSTGAGNTSSSTVEWLSDPIPAHKLILAGASKWFEARITNTPSKPASDADEATPGSKAKRRRMSVPDHAAAGKIANTPATARPRIDIPLEGEHELEAAEKVLRFLYEGQLTAGLTVQETLLVCKLAQQMRCPTCITACGAVLAAQQAQIPSDTALALFNTEASLLEENDLKEFAGLCAAAVAKDFGNTLSVWRKEHTLRPKFKKLPSVALRLLLDPNSSSQLPVDSEETLLLLLHHWVMDNEPSDEEALQLRKLLRPLGLSPSYLHFVLPQLKWLGLTTKQVTELLFAAKHITSDPPGLDSTLISGMQLFEEEQMWLQQRIYQLDAADKRFSATWTKGNLQKCIKAMLPARGRANGASISSIPRDSSVLEQVYLYGYNWQLEVRLERLPATDDGSARAGLFLVASLVDGLPDIKVIELHKDFRLALKTSPGGSPATGTVSSYCSRVGGPGCGLANFFMDSGALQLDSWAGKMHRSNIRVELS